MKAGSKTIYSEIDKHTNPVSNKEELPEEWKESIILSVYKKSDKTDCNNCRSISLLPNSYKILYNISLTRLTPYAVEITGDYQYVFRRNKSTTSHIF
jgi:hypothetical protein